LAGVPAALGASTPTIQEIIGSWTITATGELRTRVLADRGAAAAAAIGTAAAHLPTAAQRRHHHPRNPDPLERSITRDDS
jgi:hypothetical protein